ncbi:hypothetical protein NA56DRAFT_734491 [Hyaloscypha hepaticicola]|uniref:Uncharacterized protein n=1 Tax=Hyaloscypha hepaticicola TaxID=2082293 RepID=A0A2J6PLT7_9HELO|nr:hypothetical protein NA56DRAFT_734491 [Hyaloscypha hepaticicola]
MLDKKLEAVPTSAAFGFMYGFTSLRELKEVCDATYDYVFTLQNDVTRTAVRRNAAIMGEAVGVALGDVKFKVAMLFNHFLWMNLQKLLLKSRARHGSGFGYP